MTNEPVQLMGYKILTSLENRLTQILPVIQSLFLTIMAGQFDVDFYHSLAATGKSAARVKWYRTAIVALGALNYPEEIPKLYQLLLTSYIPEADQQLETGKIRESLTKVCGIMGAAKVSSSRAIFKNLTLC